MKRETLNFKIMNCEGDKSNSMEQLKSRLKSLMSDMQYEVEKIEKEGKDYEPTNPISLMGGEAMAIENLIGKIDGLNEAIKSLKDLEN